MGAIAVYTCPAHTHSECSACVPHRSTIVVSDEELIEQLSEFDDARWDAACAELARLRRMADAFAADSRVGQCDSCGHYVHTAIDEHAPACDVAIHLGLPREKGDGE